MYLLKGRREHLWRLPVDLASVWKMKHKLNLLHRIQRRVSGLGYLSGGRTSSFTLWFQPNENLWSRWHKLMPKPKPRLKRKPVGCGEKYELQIRWSSSFVCVANENYDSLNNEVVAINYTLHCSSRRVYLMSKSYKSYIYICIYQTSGVNHDCSLRRKTLE